MEKINTNDPGGNNGHRNRDEAVAVTANDVLLGRGNLVNNSAGNQMFRSLIKENAGKYVKAASRAQKELIARQILHQIEQYGGRFLRPVEESSSILTSWEVVSDEIALSKARQALRDMAQQLSQKPTAEATEAETKEETDSLGHASLGPPTDEDNFVESLLQQIQRCRQESAEQMVRLRALLVECETAATAGSSLGFHAPSLDATVLGRDALSLSDANYARVLQARELQEELDQIRLRDADLHRGEGFARLGSQTYREDDLVRLRREQEALRQYQSLADYQQRSVFPPFARGVLRPDTSTVDRSLLSLGLSRRVDPTSLDLMLRGRYPESLLGASLLSPAVRQGGILGNESRFSGNDPRRMGIESSSQLGELFDHGGGMSAEEARGEVDDSKSQSKKSDS